MIGLALLYGSIIILLIIVLIRMSRARSWRITSRTPRLTQDMEHLPTVSVCLPARNETNAMTACLESIMASTYPKLEVIVLDDNSSDNTSHLIKAFAHAGVRFIQGDELPLGWLGKNAALEQLLQEASGQYIVFMDVDTRLKPQTITRLISSMQSQNLLMTSVIPRRVDMYRLSTWFSSLHYFWLILLHRTHNPSASSALWAIRRSVLRDDLGGFSALRDQVQPEQALAHALAASGSYQLLTSNDFLGVSYAKKWRTQRENSIRLLLPQFGNSWSGILLGAIVFAYVLAPQYMLPYIWQHHYWGLLAATGVIGLLAAIIFCCYTSIVWRSRWWLSWIVAPYVLWQELVFLIASIIGYATGTVTWKGRPIKRPSQIKPPNI